MWDNVQKYCKTEQFTICHIRITCWIPSSTNTRSKYCCISSANLIARTILNVAIYSHCLSCHNVAVRWIIGSWGFENIMILFPSFDFPTKTSFMGMSMLNPLTPNDHYSGRTAPLTSKRCILYIYSTNIGIEYFKHCIYYAFFLFKMQFVS